jgi:hypothetical protein
MTDADVPQAATNSADETMPRRGVWLLAARDDVGLLYPHVLSPPFA